MCINLTMPPVLILVMFVLISFPLQNALLVLFVIILSGYSVIFSIKIKKMVSSSSMAEGLIYNIKMSSVGPGNVTSPNTIFEPRNMDMAMKLHYLRGVYYFGRSAFEGLTTLDIKEPMFAWMNYFPEACGRFRRTDPQSAAYIKCSDSGVRFLEAKCDKTLDEWLQIKDANLETLLASNQCIGPELTFSPLVYIQFTKFKCGGMAVGLSWTHALGDAFCASEFMNSLGRTVSGYDPGRPIIKADHHTPSLLSNDVEDSLAVKRVGPVGDNWVYVTKCKMEPFSFSVSPTKLSDLHSKHGKDFTPFEILSALIWQCIARIRGEELKPKVITICTKNEEDKSYSFFSNSQVVSVVKADFPVAGANPSDLASLVKKEKSDEKQRIEEVLERENGLADFIVYGANLTFVNLEEAKFYDFEYRGQKPVCVSYRIDGVGEEGAVLVLKDIDGGGRTVMAILPENEVPQFKSQLKMEGLVA